MLALFIILMTFSINIILLDPLKIYSFGFIVIFLSWLLILISGAYIVSYFTDVNTKIEGIISEITKSKNNDDDQE